jgi:hypothetical protein
VQDLLSSLESLSLEKSVSNQKVCTNKQWFCGDLVSASVLACKCYAYFIWTG